MMLKRLSKVRWSVSAIEIMPPETLEDADGKLKKAVIGTYGDTIHTLIERKDYNGIFMPGYEKSGLFQNRA